MGHIIPASLPPSELSAIAFEHSNMEIREMANQKAQAADSQSVNSLCCMPTALNSRCLRVTCTRGIPHRSKRVSVVSLPVVTMAIVTLSFDGYQLRLCYCLISSGIFDVSRILTCRTHQAELLFLF